MTRITNLEQLLAEKRRLNAELQIEKAIISDEVRKIKEKLAPLRKVLRFVGVLKPNEHDSRAQALLKTGAKVGIDLFGHRLLSRAGWISRLVVPLIAKGLSSKLVSRFVGKRNHDENVPH
jgi:hypothetical protein